MSSDPIIFYEMSSCGFCKKAKELLKPQIMSGEIVVKSSNEAPAGKFRGFPAFTYKDKIHMGLPKSYNELAEKLGKVNLPTNNKSKILLFVMDSCPHCIETKKMLASQINDGTIEIINMNDIRAKNIRAFPTFISKMDPSLVLEGKPPDVNTLMIAMGLLNNGYNSNSVESFQLPSNMMNNQIISPESILNGWKIDKGSYGYLRAGVL